ncbi:SDR family NAD(P)-dependent oxidoreductase [Nonomuraea sp. NEAU-A123]|uniref:SDR family NAD(P)-dependent oxidoreductase n=1 Tax=Nonomuraea sp. NEAU-A123 TaxID=2839649 RepID=UPI001BE44332|nr:SDR family NAD(P)-dependent oxidoreductase [Nonomuraea sp. NEAU-A123]MBT2229817.1 SDR family NAD(P)-dependent oxidoreductase [Nonomuraea sp. NEAU-A123]
MTHAGTVLLTGATGGIGSAIARALLEAGYQVLALVRDPSHLGSLAANAGPGAMDELAGSGGPGAMDAIVGLGEITPMAANLPWPDMMTATALPTDVTPTGGTSADVTPTGVKSAGATSAGVASAGVTRAGGTPGTATPTATATTGVIPADIPASDIPGGATRAGVTPGGVPFGSVTPAGVIVIVADLARPETLAAALPAIGELDAFVHCAGIAEVVPTADSSVELWRDTFNVNVASAAELLRLLLPALRTRRGRVVLINAAPGLSPRGWPAYAASKAALRELGDAVRDEECRHGIRVTTIYPGGTATELLRKVRADFGSPYDPDQCLRPSTIASLVLTALTTSPDAHLTELSVGSAD